MNSEDVINKYKDEGPKKIEYYVKLFTENGVNEKTLTEFLADNSFCTFGVVDGHAQYVHMVVLKLM